MQRCKAQTQGAWQLLWQRWSQSRRGAESMSAAYKSMGLTETFRREMLMDPEWQSGHWRESLSRWWWRWCVASGAGGAERGQITVEWGPYLGYGGGSGVWKGRWGGSHYFWSPHCYCTGRSRASACLSEPLPGGRKSVGGREKNPRTRQ